MIKEWCWCFLTRFWLMFVIFENFFSNLYTVLFIRFGMEIEDCSSVRQFIECLIRKSEKEDYRWNSSMVESPVLNTKHYIILQGDVSSILTSTFFFLFWFYCKFLIEMIFEIEFIIYTIIYKLVIDVLFFLQTLSVSSLLNIHYNSTF